MYRRVVFCGDFVFFRLPIAGGWVDWCFCDLCYCGCSFIEDCMNKQRDRGRSVCICNYIDDFDGTFHEDCGL